MGWSEARGPRPRGAVAAFFVVLIVGAPVQGQENPATQLDLPRIEVIGTTPLPGIGQLRCVDFANRNVTIARISAS